MFAPEGYISLDEVVGLLDEVANEWRLATPHADDPKPGGFFDESNFRFVDDEWPRRVAYRHWLLNCFLNRHEKNLFVCTSNGKALKLSDSLTVRLKIYDGPFEDAPDAWNSLIEHLESPFLYISCDGYKIDFERAQQFSGGMNVNPLLANLDQLPVCWPLPESNDRLDWRRICGLSGDALKRKADLSPAAVSKSILSTWYENKALRKLDIKEIVAPTLSSRQFDRAWIMAVQENPSLAKPGRKKT